MNKTIIIQELIISLALSGFSDGELRFILLLICLMVSDIKHVSLSININSGNKKSYLKDKRVIQ